MLQKKLDSAGSARWANKKELERAKVLVDPGFIGNAVIVGCWDTGMDYEKVFAFCRKTATAFVKLRNLGKKLIGERLAKSLKIPIMQNLSRQRKYLIRLGVGLDYFHLSLNVNIL